MAARRLKELHHEIGSSPRRPPHHIEPLHDTVSSQGSLESCGRHTPTSEDGQEEEECPETLQHGGITPEQLELFQQCVHERRPTAEMAHIIREAFPNFSWSILRCPATRCDLQIESSGFAELTFEEHTYALIANVKEEGG
eukprot:TRINITY_DN2571_c0_g1_i1.p1 TRINITY_DN2571_c0_g1~~TRINITY_DN2571_c0_g1_i1.p1  ORF type:complete len:140 (-),score=19.94 TRINITY_DN2571_c0_g1_i1:30-449(-)